jgi:type II secretory pathway component GspD/PulD (secretin)
MSQRLLVLVLFALAIVATATAQDRPAEVKRGAYVVKYAGAKDLAAMLAKHFKGAAEVQVGPAGTSNCLLINAPPAVFDEALKLLDQLDRRPQSVGVEVFMVELPAKKGEDKEKGLDAKDLTGAIGDVASRLDALTKKGTVVGVKRIQLTTLEGQSSALTLGETKPFALSPGTITYRNVGTQVRVTPLVMADLSIALDLSVQDSRGRDSATEPGKPEFIQTSLNSKLSVTSGRALVAEEAKVTSKEGQGETLIVVGARIIEPDGKGR